MTDTMRDGGPRGDGALRLLLWGAAAGLWLLPLAAMQVTDEVSWDATDFAAFGAMLLLAVGACELGLRASRDLAYRVGFALAVGAAFLLTWASLAVGLIGDGGHPANLLLFAVLASAAAGAALARLQPGGMARAMLAAALVQLAMAAAGVLAGDARGAVFTGMLATPWLAAAVLFRLAQRRAGASGG
jgi:hypothetical protein